jgi:hypothetical protein
LALAQAQVANLQQQQQQRQSAKDSHQPTAASNSSVDEVRDTLSIGLICDSRNCETCLLFDEAHLWLLALSVNFSIFLLI